MNRSLRMHNCMKSAPLLELNWRFLTPKVQGFFRNEFLFFMKCFQIFINVHFSTIKKKNLGFRNYFFCPKKIHLLFIILQCIWCIWSKPVHKQMCQKDFGIKVVFKVILHFIKKLCLRNVHILKKFLRY